MEKALLIEVDFSIGKRAGNISPKDPNLFCRGWQDLKSKPGKEIRLVLDNRDLSQYEGVEGVTILEGKEIINQAITDNIPERYAVKDKELLFDDLAARGIALSTRFKGTTLASEAKALFDEGMAGVVETKPELI